MSNPAVISGCTLLPSMWADPPFILGVLEPVELLQTLRVLRMGGRPSHPIFREYLNGEVRRILFPRRWVNKARGHPDRPGTPKRGCSHRRVLCARTAGEAGRGLRASGRGAGKRKAGPLWGGGVSECARLNNNQIILRGVRSTYAKREVFHKGG